SDLRQTVLEGWNRRENVDGRVYHVIETDNGERYVRAWFAAVAEKIDRPREVAEDEPWVHVDLGEQTLVLYRGDMPIYATLVAHQVAYILEDAGARLVFCSTKEQMDKALEACRSCSADVRVVVFDEVGPTPDGVVTWSRFLARGEARMASVSGEEFRASATRPRPEDVATLLYTSGTTGDPKGVMLTHDNLYSNVEAASRALPITEDDVTLSFLPLSHVLQRMVDYLLFSRGCTIAYAHAIETVADDLRIVRPTVVVSVPRLYEKVYNKVMEAEGLKGRLVHWAREVGTRWAEDRLQGRQPGALTQVAWALADRLVYRKIRAGVGGRLRYFVSGGAPLEPDIARFFYSVGLPVLEGYGLTETSPVTNVNTPDDICIGTVGKPVAGTEIRIADDGEILVRGRQVMKGYYRPEDTAEAFDEEGWFRTGDIGELDVDGFLRITDRKKDIIVTAGGKNVAPQPIENRLKTHPLVEQVVMVGDKRKFVALLLVPSFPQLESWARAQEIDWSDRRELLREPRVQDHVAKEIFAHVGELASYESPKKIGLLEKEFTIEDGTLTPSQKVRRRAVQERYRGLIDRFYAEENVDEAVFVDHGGAEG
ncbi:MAG: long-chain fatty acid--CoA ligase, partial [Gemmatimonadetes bacterium]|nr:long-chain fatty acid--CoA ligase [Gemmatimonadota bacterium]